MDDAENHSQQQPQQIRLNRVTARVPEGVGRGVFGTGAIVMSGANELLVDFTQQMGRPHNVVARVVLPLSAMPQVIHAIEQNLKAYEQKFGQPKELPKPDPSTPRPPIQEVYENLKLPDEMLSGTYANAVLIGYTAAEFSFDFITNFFPHAAVSSRVFLSAPHVVQLLDSLKSNLKQVQERMAQRRERGESPPADDEGPQAPPGVE